MKPLSPCKPYHAVVGDREMWRRHHSRSVFKIYYVDIVGRDTPERYEWRRCGLSKEAYHDLLLQTPEVEGVGFITAFPHITKVFRFGPEAETVLNVRAWTTLDMKPLDLGRSSDYLEFACLAEAALAADEFAIWAAATSVDEYLQRWSDYRNGPIARHDKLAAYWA